MTSGSSCISGEVRMRHRPEVQRERVMWKSRQTAWVLRFLNMLWSRAGLAPQTMLESFPRFWVIRQGFQGQQCHSLSCSEIIWPDAWRKPMEFDGPQTSHKKVGGNQAGRWVNSFWRWELRLAHLPRNCIKYYSKWEAAVTFLSSVRRICISA